MTKSIIKNTNKLPELITSDNIILRVPTITDGFALYQAVSESYEQLILWLPWVKMLNTVQLCEQSCDEAYTNFLFEKDYRLLIFCKTTNQLIGGCGLHNIDWETKKFEVGYWGVTKYLGRGLLTEAIIALRDFAINNLQANRLYLTTDEKNLKSQALAIRAGFVLEGTLHLERLNHFNQLRNTQIYAIWKK